MICQSLSHVEVIGNDVRCGRYDLIGTNGAIILPNCWSASIKPGMNIKMEMWPRSANPNLMQPWNAPARRPLDSGVSQQSWADSPPPPPQPFPRPRGPGMYPPGVGLPRPPPGVGIPVGMPPPPPPPGQMRPVVITPGRTMRRRSSFSSNSSYSNSDSEVSETDPIESEECDFGIKFDYVQEQKEAKTSVKDLLIKWTHAVDVEFGNCYSSDSGTESSLTDD